MLTAYMDESGYGGHDNGRIVLAGFLGSMSQWKDIENKWATALGKKTRFHMTELRWSGRNLERSQSLLTRLAPIPNECGLTAVFSSVKLSDYADLIAGDLYREKINKPYTVAILPMLLTVLDEVPQDQRIKFVFEQQNEYEIWVRATFQLFKNRGQTRLEGVEFVPKDSTVMLHPADFLSYALMQHYQNPRSTKSKLTEPIILTSLRRFINATPTREHLREVIGQLKRKTENT